jgi:hypothetical protein
VSVRPRPPVNSVLARDHAFGPLGNAFTVPLVGVFATAAVVKVTRRETAAVFTDQQTRLMTGTAICYGSGDALLVEFEMAQTGGLPKDSG